MDLTTIVQLVVSGATIGCIYSLVGLGFSLTLRATELINFAQGELLMVGAFFGLTLLTVLHLPFVVVFVIASAGVGLLSLALERVVLRPMLIRKTPLLNLLIATLGISITLQALAIVIWGRQPIPYPPLFDTQPVVIGGIRIQLLNLWILGLGLIVMVALHAFFKWTIIGISWRAAALDSVTAALYGVSRGRNVGLTFALSGALAGGAGVLIAPLFFASAGIGHGVMIKAFAAAAIGGFGIVGTMVGGVVLGIVETLAAGLISSEYKNIIMYVILLAILMFFFRAKALSGRSLGETARVVRPLELAARLGRWQLLLLAAVAVCAWAAMLSFSDAYFLRVVNLAAIAGIAVLGLQLIVGYTGQFSFGQGAFYGIGAYVAAILSVRYNASCLITLPLAAIGAGVAGLIVAPILRLSGHYLAIATLAMGDIVFSLINNLKGVTNGAYGIYGIPPLSLGGFEIESDGAFFVAVSVILLVVFFLLTRLIHSRFGRSLIAVRENELAAAASGINPARQKVLAFVIGSGCAGLAGGLYAHYVAYISPEAFDFARSVEMVTMVVIGGLGSMTGGLIGALVVVAMPEYLRFLADYRLVVYGLMLIVFMVGLPGGLMDVARQALRIVRRKPLSRTATS